MSYETLGGIKAEAWGLLRDPDGRMATATNIIDWWYEAVKKYARATLHFKKQSTGLFTAAYTREISMPTDFIKAVSVNLFDPTITISTSNTVLETDTFADGHTLPWLTSPCLTVSSNPFVEETFTLSMVQTSFGLNRWNVTGSVSGLQDNQYNSEVYGSPGGTPEEDADYVTAANADGLGYGLTFRLRKSSTSYPTLEFTYTYGDTITIVISDFGQKPLRQTDKRELSANTSTWLTQRGEPTHYYEQGSDTSTIKLGFSPIPDGKYPVLVDYACIPAKQSDDADVPYIPIDDRANLMHWVLFNAYMNSRDVETAMEHKRQFLYDMDSAATDRWARLDRPARVTNTRFKRRRR